MNIKKYAISIGICIMLFGAVGLVTQMNLNSDTPQDPRLVDTLQRLGIATSSEMESGVIRAWEIVSPEIGMDLVSINQASSGVDGNEYWGVRFQDDFGNRILVELDCESLDLLFIWEYSEGSRSPLWRLDITEVESIATEYIENLREKNWISYDGILEQHIYRDDTGWRIAYDHFVQSIRVDDDYIAIRMNPDSGEVISFSNNLHQIDNLAVPELDAEQALAQFESTFKCHIDLQSDPELVIIESSRFDFECAWILTEVVTENQFWISAVDGELLDSDIYLNYGTAYLAVQTELPHFGVIGDDLYDRLQHHYITDIDYDVTNLGLMAALETDDVVVFLGHGYYGLAGHFLATGPGATNPWPNFLCWFSNIFIPYNSPTKLFMAVACHSLVDASGALGNTAIERGIGCYGGWTITVLSDMATDFTQWFFDAAVNGETFAYCEEYAENKMNPNEYDDSYFELQGDSDLFLYRYDAAPGFNIATQRYSHYVGTTNWETPVRLEPLWGEDIDAYRTTLTGSHELQISLITSPECKAEITVYKWSSYRWLWYTSATSSSPGQTLYLHWTRSVTTEYLVVIRVSDGHGGWYVFNFNEILS